MHLLWSGECNTVLCPPLMTVLRRGVHCGPRALLGRPGECAKPQPRSISDLEIFLQPVIWASKSVKATGVQLIPPGTGLFTTYSKRYQDSGPGAPQLWHNPLWMWPPRGPNVSLHETWGWGSSPPKLMSLLFAVLWANPVLFWSNQTPCLQMAWMEP